MLQEEPHQCSGSGDGDSQEIYEEEDCECETEQLVWTGGLNNNNNITKEPPILEHFELMQHSLDFLESLKTISKPIVEVSLLPNIRFKEKTLVLDLDETLVHSSLQFVPDADIQFDLKVPDVGWRTVYVKFLREAARLFEVVVFTASPSLYGNRVIDWIDPEQSFISHRLFRSECFFHQGRYVKHLEILGRDLSKVAIIDNSVEAMGFQLENGILIDDFYSDPSDRCLLDCLQFLHIMDRTEDTREAIQHYYRESM